jgi:single-stranded-DNA-specific exonuclease
MEIKRKYPVQQNNFEFVINNIINAIFSSNNIAIFGDYDADGICSALIMKKTLDKIGIKNIVRLPERKEGYGIKAFHVRELNAKGFDTILTVDNGIAGFEAANEAKRLGMKMIVTDHHEPQNELPNADIIFDPKLYNSYKDYSGAGVAYLVARELLKAKKIPITDDLLQLAGLATVADVVPLDGNNWYIARKGLEYMRQKPLLGIQKLLEVASVEPQKVGGFEMGWVIAPRINAAGRVDSPMLGYKLLAEGIGAEELDRINRERLELVNSYMEKVNDRSDLFLIYIFENCPKGIIGLIAGRAAEKFQKPVLVGTTEGGTNVTASVRTAGNFDVLSAFDYASQFLDISYGGHKSACGVHFNASDTERLQKILNQYVLRNPVEFDVNILDGVLTAKPSVEEVEKFDLFEPFGFKNPEPAFLLQGKVTGIQKNEKWQLVKLDNGMGFFGSYDYAVGQDVQVVVRPIVKGNYVNFKVLDEKPIIQI